MQRENCLAAQIAQERRLLRRERVIERDDQKERFLEQRHGLDVRPLERQGGHDHVEIAGLELVGEGRGHFLAGCRA